MSLFPFVAENPVQNNTARPVYREYEIDFQTDRFTGRILEGRDALKAWIDKTLLTDRNRHIIYSTDYGCELTSLIGKGYEKGLVDSEAKRYVEECLSINPCITGVTNFNVEYQGDVLTLDFTVLTVYGEVDVHVPR